MNRRHEDQLLVRLDELLIKGTTFITWGEIYHWYRIERIAKHPWRDMKRRWDELLEERGISLSDPQVASLDAGIAMFFPGDPKRMKKLGEWAE